MINIIGTYECKMDVKGRFMFPADLKNQLGEEAGMGFIMKRSIFHKCLELYPRSEWDLESKKINQLNRFKKKNVDFIRKFMAGVRLLSLDGTGRLLIPRDLKNFSGIQKEIVLASVGNKVEIWPREQYENVVDYDHEEFGDLAEELMGNVEPEE